MGARTLKPNFNWPLLIIGILLSSIFFLFGVRQLISSYYATDPHLFLMLFFSSSMIILVNGAIFIVLIILGYKKSHGPGRPEIKQAPPAVDCDEN